MSNDAPPPYNPAYQPPPPAGPYPSQVPPTGYPMPGYPPQPPMTDYGGTHQVPPPPPPMHAPYTPYPPQRDAEWGPPHEDDLKSSEIGFSNATIRRGFVRKVFSILTLQLMFLAAIVALFVFEENTKHFVQANKGLYWASYGVFLVTYIAIACCEGPRRRFPGNMICLVMLTVSMTYMVAMIASFYNVEDVFIALAITVGCCAGIVVFSMQTKYDFTGCISIMVVLGFALFFFGLISMIRVVAIGGRGFDMLHMLYCGLSALFFMVWLAIDVQLVMGGKRHEISPEDYVFAATQLFLDIVYIFLYILRIVGYASKNN